MKGLAGAKALRSELIEHSQGVSEGKSQGQGRESYKPRWEMKARGQVMQDIKNMLRSLNFIHLFEREGKTEYRQTLG